MNIKLLNPIETVEAQAEDGWGLMTHVAAHIDGAQAVADIHEWDAINESCVWLVDDEGNQVGDPIPLPVELIKQWEIGLSQERSKAEREQS